MNVIFSSKSSHCYIFKVQCHNFQFSRLLSSVPLLVFMEGDSPFVRLSLNIHYILLLAHPNAQQLHKFYVVCKIV